MKKFTVLFVLMGLLFSFQSIAGNGDLFTYDKEKVNTEMAQLNMLEDVLIQDANLTYTDLLEVDNSLVANLDYSSNAMMAGMSAGPVIPSFWWGCLFGPIGVLVVYLVEEDRDETRSAIWGCVISAVLSGASSILWGVWASAQ
jgi:hypothetical protein